MNIKLRKSQQSDIPFLKEMLYEAVFWRNSLNKPSFDVGLSYPDVSKSLADWGNRDGDMAVISCIDSTPVGAAWVRYWNNKVNIRGYIEEKTPVLVIGVHRAYRRLGIAEKMINWLIDEVSKYSIQEISLMVTKDNHALYLYLKCGFKEFDDKGDSLLMLRKI